MKADKYYLAYVCHPSDFMKPTHIKSSWNEASELCESVGGSLPTINSKKDQNDIISLLISHYLPPIKVVFLGLVMNSSRVS